MARAILTDLKQDLITDEGAVLWSFVRGEQQEYSIILNFLENAGALAYIFEAVVIEAANTLTQDRDSKPVTIQPAGIQTTLTVRVPTYRGNWDAPQAYNREDYVAYGGKHYKLKSGTARVSSVTPDLDPVWEVHLPNKVYVQFPSTLGANYTVQPSVAHPVYGFFELRVTEPADAIFTRTWKPVRGMVEILFSPTEVVP